MSSKLAEYFRVGKEVITLFQITVIGTVLY